MVKIDILFSQNHAIVDEDGTVEQITNYYPFGAPYSDATTTNPTLQRYKYNGKELELMHGLKWYDYGARWYDPLLVSWNRPFIGICHPDAYNGGYAIRI